MWFDNFFREVFCSLWLDLSGWYGIVLRKSLSKYFNSFVTFELQNPLILLSSKIDRNSDFNVTKSGKVESNDSFIHKHKLINRKGMVGKEKSTKKDINRVSFNSTMPFTVNRLIHSDNYLLDIFSTNLNLRNLK